MKAGNILLIIGLIGLIVGAVLAYFRVTPASDYVLVVSAIMAILSGSLRMRDK